jgi:Eco57I restriction-modification methylase/TaqI-like C-terminal specificity domain
MDKSTAQRTVSQTFKAAFDRDRFRNFVNELTNGFDETKKQTMQIPDAFKPHVASCQRIGTYESPEHELADVLIVHLTESYKLERTRTALRDFVAHKLKRGDGEDNAYKEAAIVAFVAPDAKSWRFSFVRMEYETKRDPKTGRIKPEERLTPARRYSYLVGAEEECHTAQARFLDLLKDTTSKPALAKIEEAFSVESVTKEFFNQYAGLFQRTHAALEAIIATDEVVKADFQAKGVSTVDFAKKLLGQIVFLHFIQKKGWLGVPKGGKWGDGPKNFMRQLADRSLADGKCLFNEVLEPLFYDTLATDRGHEAWCKPFACRIPFLNGGLFEPISGYDWQSTSLAFSNDLFTNSDTTKEGDTGTGILDVFDRYNFTVNEAEPLEKEVAIDPEMLGKVFENLIEENRRKGLGAYYTPREIVHYMCQESLINYLDTTLNPESSQVPRSDIETFIREGDQAAHYEIARKGGTVSYARKVSRSIETHARALDDALKSITVCDPAIGSGAFPVGMMTEIVKARTALTPYFNDVAERTPYHFKRHAIQNSIYGVDIDAGAVEIAKLRLWLSLVVDEEDVTQIKPLPNLDYKVVVGNSLMGFPFKSARIHKIEALKAKFFDESDATTKRSLRKEIDTEIGAAFAASKQSLGYQVTFDFHLFFSEVFSEKSGFDVVIANPPYLGERGNKDTFREINLSSWGAKNYRRKMDLFYYFFHLSLDLSKQKGSVCFITTNYWITADGALKLRQDIKNRATILNLINFGEMTLFETAQGQHNMITLISKGSSLRQAKTLVYGGRREVKAAIIDNILNNKNENSIKFSLEQNEVFDGDENFVRLQPLNSVANSNLEAEFDFSKIDRDSISLSSISMSIFMGVQTGCDVVTENLIQSALKKNLISEKDSRKWTIGRGIYVISENELKNLNLSSSEIKDCLRPFFKNSEIEKYATTKNATRYLLYVDSKTNIKLYPNIEKHLLLFKPLLAAREQAVVEARNWFWIRGSKRESFALRNDIIVVPYRAKSNRFSACSMDIFGAGDLYYISLNHSVSNNAILGFLNSSIVLYHLKKRGKLKGDTIEYYKNPLEKIPVHKRLVGNDPVTIELGKIVLDIIKNKRNPNFELASAERKIDQIIYNLYNLSSAEIKIIENSNG